MLSSLLDFSALTMQNFLNFVTAKWLVIIFLIVYAVNYLFKQQLRILWLLFQLPGPRGHPILGHFTWLIDPKPFTDAQLGFYKLHGPVIGLRGFLFPFIGVLHPKDLQKVLASSKHVQKPFFYSFLKNFLGDGLLTSDVSIWRNHRRIIQPHFHVKYLEEYFPVFNKGSQLLVEAFKDHPGVSSGIDITSLINKCVLCILSESVLGLDHDPKTAFKDIDSLPYRQGVKSVVDRLVKPWLSFDFIYERTNQVKQDMDLSNSMVEYTKRLIQKRRKMIQDGLVKNKCFLDFFLDLSDNENFSEEDCIKEACTFMLAGQDSVAATVAFSLHQIANHAEVQEKIVAELESIFGDSERIPTASDVREMVYLEQCIKETMRLFPAVPLIMRVLGEDVKTGNYTLPKGCKVLILPWATQMLDEFYPNPEIFNPDNFNAYNCEKRHPFAFLPFSAGPRNCIGYKFAMIEMKTIICNVLKNYRLTPVKGKEMLNVQYRLTTRAHGGVWITLTPREKN